MHVISTGGGAGAHPIALFAMGGKVRSPTSLIVIPQRSEGIRFSHPAPNLRRYPSAA